MNENNASGGLMPPSCLLEGTLRKFYFLLPGLRFLGADYSSQRARGLRVLWASRVVLLPVSMVSPLPLSADLEWCGLRSRMSSCAGGLLGPAGLWGRA